MFVLFSPIVLNTAKPRMSLPATDYAQLTAQIKTWGRELGFQQLGIADIQLAEAEQHLLDWLEQGYHGSMDYMQRHGVKRSRPAELLPGTLRVISVRMDYLPEGLDNAAAVLADADKAYIARYALGRDYHKLLRQRLQKLAERIETLIGPFGYRVFCDSAPVLEKALAENAGLGWIGKHTNLINRQAGSWFFLGEIYTDLPLMTDTPAINHCGSCRACLEACPTAAIIAPYTLDARRCIAYLTIESADSIPLALRPALGNRIYGCDDCQLVCPWNRYAKQSSEADFLPRHGLACAELLDLFSWDERCFLHRTEGSAIRRIGHERWLRNIAVALGNSVKLSPSPFGRGVGVRANGICDRMRAYPKVPASTIVAALNAKREHPAALVREHVIWALEQF